MTEDGKEAGSLRESKARAAGSPYEAAALGFRNYWYPACLSKEVTEKPKPLKLLGEPIVFLRRNGKAYALADECAHRGTKLSRGKYVFPGTPTITCCYHGWTYDVTTGICVGALTEGPDSRVRGKFRVRTYPVEERKGIVWFWPGETAPVPLEEDVPKLLLRPDACVHLIRRWAYGNWRYHAENVGGGHALMLHRDSLKMYFFKQIAHGYGYKPELGTEGEDSPEWILDQMEGRVPSDNYPGLGQWPKPRWRPFGRKREPLLGVSTIVSIRLPGVTRVLHFPIRGAIYYEWYVPIDEDHYIYFQVTSSHPKNWLDSLWWHLRYYSWGLPAGIILFNAQDMGMVRDSTDYAKRHGGNWPAPLFGPDSFQIAWIRYCNQRARGEVASAKEAEQAPAYSPAD